MQRIALILLLFVLLMNGRHLPVPVTALHYGLTVTARPLKVDSAQARRDYGPLRLLGAWELDSANKGFGGISSLLAEPDGRLIGLDDTGEIFGFGAGPGSAKDFYQPLPVSPDEQRKPRFKWDSESMAREPVSGRVWVGFELIGTICRYSPDFARREACREWPELDAWPQTLSIESFQRLSDGRFLAISEGGLGKDGVHDALLWQGDPADPRTPPPVHMGYLPPTGYRPTEALWLGGNRLLVLNRRLTLAAGFTAKLVLVHMPPLREGALLRGKGIARFGPPNLSDNMEAMALGREAGGPVLWVASDDNHFVVQRTLLFRFALPRDWVSDQPAP